ncbi:MAG: hypothetical protein ACYDBA_00005, partial [Sulfuricaulis sp.]
ISRPTRILRFKRTPTSPAAAGRALSCRHLTRRLCASGISGDGPFPPYVVEMVNRAIHPETPPTDNGFNPCRLVYSN